VVLCFGERSLISFLVGLSNVAHVFGHWDVFGEGPRILCLGPWDLDGGNDICPA